MEILEIDKRLGLWAYKSWADKSFNEQINFFAEKRLSGKNADACFKCTLSTLSVTKILMVFKNLSMSYFFPGMFWSKAYPRLSIFFKARKLENFPRICNSTKFSTCKIKTCQKTLPWSSGSRQCCNGMTYCTFYLWCAVHLKGLLRTAWNFDMKCYWCVRIKSSE